jgi:hypothetical protein
LVFIVPTFPPKFGWQITPVAAIKEARTRLTGCALEISTKTQSYLTWTFTIFAGGR